MTSFTSQLSNNGVELMLRKDTDSNNNNNGTTTTTIQPILQVISIKPIKEGNANAIGGGGGGSVDRYRLILSDGTHYIQSMTGPTSLNQQNTNSTAITINTIGEIQVNSIIRMHDYIPKVISKRLVIIVVSFTVIELPKQQPVSGDSTTTTSNAGRIGNPQDIEKSIGIIDDLLQFAKTTTGFTSLQSINSSSNSTSTGSRPLQNSTNTPMMTTTSSSSSSLYSKPLSDNNSATNPYGRSSSNAIPQSTTSSYNNNNTNAPIVRSLAMSHNTHITPISALNMYNNKWTIQARVTTKSEIRTWSNNRGEGSLFSIELLDGGGTDIKATFFKEAVDKFYNMLTVGSVYTLTGGRLKVANLQYNTCKSSFEITFDNNAEIHLQNDTKDILKQQYDFIPNIAALEQYDPTTIKTIDILAVVKSVGQCHTLVSKKSGQELIKCDIELCDNSNVEITMTLWSTMAENAQSLYNNHPIIAIRRAKLSEYGGGKSLGMSQGSGSIDTTPDTTIPQVQQLRQWYDTIGRNQLLSGGSNGSSSALTTTVKSLSSNGGGGVGGLNRMDNLQDRKEIYSIKEQNLGYNDKADYITIKGVCTFIKKDKEGGAWYPACPNAGEPCRNLFKVTQGTDGQWLCEKCSNYYPNPIRRWIFSAVFEDVSGSTWVSFFNEQAEKLLMGTSADDGYAAAYNSNGEDNGFNTDEYESIFYKALNKEYIIKCKVKNEINPNDGEARIKTSVVAIEEINYYKECIDLLTAIEQMQ